MLSIMKDEKVGAVVFWGAKDLAELQDLAAKSKKELGYGAK